MPKAPTNRVPCHTAAVNPPLPPHKLINVRLWSKRAAWAQQEHWRRGADWLVSGDILVLIQVLDAKHKDWVKRLLIPYYIFSAIAAVVSLAALLSKLSLLVSKFKRRSIGRHRPHSQDVAHLLRGADKDRVQLAEKFDRSGPVALPSARLFAGVAVRCLRVRFHGRKTKPQQSSAGSRTPRVKCTATSSSACLRTRP